MNATRFIHDLTWDDMPPEVRHQAVRCLLDTIGTAIGGRQTTLSGIMYNQIMRRVFMAGGGLGCGLMGERCRCLARVWHMR